MTPLRVVVLFGGRSPEHDVSCSTATVLVGGLDTERYRIVPIGITEAGQWVHAEAAAEAIELGLLPDRFEPVGPLADPWTVLRPEGEEPGVVYPMLLGPNGEDGTVQGLFELADVPYVGAGVIGSALGLSKAVAKELLAGRGVPQARHLAITGPDVDEVLAGRVGDEIGYPVVVKPSGQGSSVGVVLVAGPDQLAAALDEALRYDDEIVIEEYLEARELQCAVLGDGEPIPSAVAEVVTDKAVYDFAEKYTASTARVILPADLPPGVTEEAQAQAVATYRALRTTGMARVDLFLVDRDGPKVLVNEINTLPAVTARRIVPRLWEEVGFPLPDLLDRLIDDALARHSRRAVDATRPYRLDADS